MTSIDQAAESLVGLIVSARFRNPASSDDPYSDALAAWVFSVSEARNILSLNGIVETALSEVERVYREAVAAWLRGDDATDPDDAELFAALRDALDPPITCIG